MTALYRALPGGELMSMRPQPLPTAPGAAKVGPSRNFTVCIVASPISDSPNAIVLELPSEIF